MATGHRTIEMLDHYTDHTKTNDRQLLKIAQREVFESIIEGALV